MLKKSLFLVSFIFVTGLVLPKTVISQADSFNGETDDTETSDDGESAEKQAKNAFYLEFLGKGFYYSLNYERNLFTFKEKISLQASIGFSSMNGYTASEDNELPKTKDLLIPFEFNVMYNITGAHNAVIGYGTTMWRYNLVTINLDDDTNVYDDNGNNSGVPAKPELKKVKEWFAHFVIEYRYQKPGGGLMLKAGYTPLFFKSMPNFEYQKVYEYQKKYNYATTFNFGVGYTF